MSKQSYNIILNSQKGTQLNGFNTSIQYNFDTNIIPIGDYNLSYAFTSKSNNITSGCDIALIQLDLGQNLVYAPATQFGATASKILGFVQPVVMGSSTFLIADNSTNPPIFISWNRPNNNLIVNIFRPDLITYWKDSSLADLSGYVLILKLIPV